MYSSSYPLVKVLPKGGNFFTSGVLFTKESYRGSEDEVNEGKFLHFGPQNSR